MNEYRDLLDDARSFFQQLKEMGVDTLALETTFQECQSRKEILDAYFDSIRECADCPLCEGRTQVVFADGNPDADLMFIGEGPGRDEDAQGLPFVGRAGQLLTKMIEAMGLDRQQDTYICNIVKCRPPENRNPEPDEMAACWKHLEFQINVIQPKIIVLLGNVPLHGLLGIPSGIMKLRGKWHDYKGIPVMPTLHPAFLCRYPKHKGEAWSDLKAVLERMGRTPPSR